jgi:hypothetical protein
MSLTMNTSKIALDHVMDIVLARGPTSPLKQSLLKHGFTDIDAFHMLDDQIIDCDPFLDAMASFAFTHQITNISK